MHPLGPPEGRSRRPGLREALHTASPSRSPVRTRSTLSTGATQILPSPIVPVFAHFAMASTTVSASSSPTTTSKRILGSNAGWRSPAHPAAAARPVTSWPYCQAKPADLSRGHPASAAVNHGLDYIVEPFRLDDRGYQFHAARLPFRSVARPVKHDALPSSTIVHFQSLTKVRMQLGAKVGRGTGGRPPLSVGPRRPQDRATPWGMPRWRLRVSAESAAARIWFAIGKGLSTLIGGHYGPIEPPRDGGGVEVWSKAAEGSTR